MDEAIDFDAVCHRCKREIYQGRDHFKIEMDHYEEGVKDNKASSYYLLCQPCGRSLINWLYADDEMMGEFDSREIEAWDIPEYQKDDFRSELE